MGSDLSTDVTQCRRPIGLGAAVVWERQWSGTPSQWRRRRLAACAGKGNRAFRLSSLRSACLHPMEVEYRRLCHHSPWPLVLGVFGEAHPQHAHCTTKRVCTVSRAGGVGCSALLGRRCYAGERNFVAVTTEVKPKQPIVLPDLDCNNRKCRSTLGA